MKHLLLAKYVAPITTPTLRDGAVVIEDGVIVTAGDAHALIRQHPGIAIDDLGDSILLPGLVNAHVHLELTAVGQLPRPANFVDWILALRDQLVAAGDVEELMARGCRVGIEQCLRFGITAVGDVSRFPAITRRLLRESVLKGISFGEVLGMAGRSEQLPKMLSASADRSLERPGLRCGIEPHAVYSLDLQGFAHCAQLASKLQLPLASHVAESPHETEFLASHGGEFRRLWQVLGGWTGGVSTFSGGPLCAMQSTGIMEQNPVLAHVNYVSDDEMDLLAGSCASVVYCPRTHAYFKHPPHRFIEMLDRGINVAIGTDSAASSPDLNVVDDLRLVHQLYPQLDVLELWNMVTIRAARALGIEASVGAIAPGRAADFCVFAAGSDNPLLELLAAPALPTLVYVAGRRVG